MSLERLTTFALSKRPLAIDRSTFTAGPQFTANNGRPLTAVRVTVLYPRRSRGQLGAHLGEVWDYLPGPALEATLENLIARCQTARYGPSPLARWTPGSLWTPKPVDEAERARLRTILAPALEHLAGPIAAREQVDPPSGWDGWYQLR